MRQKSFILQNRGMNRDLSISKVGESTAYENHNIRIIARDHDTLLSVTNERGNKRINLKNSVSLAGEFVGGNILNDNIIVFTHQAANTDRIYRIKHTVEQGQDVFTPTVLIEDNLGFSTVHPIESVVYYESEDVQKIYWVDGVHVLRFMNFAADADERASWTKTSFDSCRVFSSPVSVNVKKDHAGNPRANGVVQYFLTYFNKHGQESAIAWASDLIYLSPEQRGGDPDGNNNNRVTITVLGADMKYTNYRVYSIFRSSLGSTNAAYLVAEGKIHRTITGGTITVDPITVVDDGINSVIDPLSLLYLGSKEAKVGTIAHKDDTLFLGNIQIEDNSGLDTIQAAITADMFIPAASGPYYESNSISFENSNSEYDIPYIKKSSEYSDENQLKYSSSEITMYKGGETYRFGLVFYKDNGTASDVFWIGDKENSVYPAIYTRSSKDYIKRPLAICSLPAGVVSAAKTAGFSYVQLMYAEATYADRTVKAQGIINPTMFNVWSRYNGRTYSMSSWISRPRGSSFAFWNFEPVHCSAFASGEIDCNYWEPNAAGNYSDTTIIPYVDYSLSGTSYDDHAISANSNYKNQMLLYGIMYDPVNYEYNVKVACILTTAASAPNTASFDENNVSEDRTIDFEIVSSNTAFRILWSEFITGGYSEIYNNVYSYVTSRFRVADPDIINGLNTDFDKWLRKASTNQGIRWITNPRLYTSDSPYWTDWLEAANASGYSGASSRWKSTVNVPFTSKGPSLPAEARSNMMYVDENIITLNSPEISYDKVTIDSTDGISLHLVGIVPIISGYSDYTVDATHGHLAGENLIKESFGGSSENGDPTYAIDGLVSWPLWFENGLKEDENNPIPVRLLDRVSSNYQWADNTTVRYWLHMWNHAGVITGFNDTEGNNYSELKEKTFANLRYSYETLYSFDRSYNLDCIRTYKKYDSRKYDIKVGTGTGAFVRQYSGDVSEILTCPSNFSYPIFYSTEGKDKKSDIQGTGKYLYSKSPVLLEYKSDSHFVMSLPTVFGPGLNYTLVQHTVLPMLTGELPAYDSHFGQPASNYQYLLPWFHQPETASGDCTKCQILRGDTINVSTSDKYLFVGEVRADISPDSRYGGRTKSAVESCRFVPASPKVSMFGMSSTGTPGAENNIYSDRGDTYFQRWNCLKTMPGSSANNVIDITSFMVESHINLAGIYDKQTDTKYLASIDVSKYGRLNEVYSQPDNFFVRRDLDTDLTQVDYSTAITWTLPKKVLSSVDDWTHITLASSLLLDGDKGKCQALRRFQNNIYAFQDRALSEILFNSRTQLSTTDGVPVELGNSGKVDGKRYVSGNNGCTNKWSIAEGKNALYFVDNINKNFCAFNGSSVADLSTKHGFGVWFREVNTVDAWTPGSFNNIVSFYDRTYNDVYLVKGGATAAENQALVYNELLDSFTSFFDYGSVPFMANLKDKFISFKSTSGELKLWEQNKGLYCNFFGTQKDYSVIYRVAPEPVADKIWTNIDAQVDFFDVLTSGGEASVPEGALIDGGQTASGQYWLAGAYIPNECFSSMEIWNEYQKGTVNASSTKTPTKKFRTWRYLIPRADRTETNKYGLDRIRNPWVFVKFSKTVSGSVNQYLMQLHDIEVKYFE